MTPDEPGLLGNLPRSRPGTRSDKRGGGSKPKPASKPKAAAKPASKPKAAAKPASKPKAKAAPKPKPAPKPKAPPPPPPEPEASNPIDAAVKVAGAGLRVAEEVTREVLRRLPRP